MKIRFVGVIVLITVLMLSGCGLGSSGPSQVAKDFFLAVEKGEIDKAENLLSKEAKARFGGELKDYLRKLTQSLQEQGGIKSIEIVEEKVTGEIATVEMKVVIAHGGVAIGPPPTPADNPQPQPAVPSDGGDKIPPPVHRDEKVITFTHDLLKENGEWKLDLQRLR